MGKKIRLRIVTPAKMLFDDDVDMAVIRASEGEMGILAEHTPLTTTLAYGPLRAISETPNGQEEQIFSVLGGFVEVTPELITVMSDAAERPDEIDKNRAQEAKERAERHLAQGKTGGVDVHRAELALRRALVRLEVSDYPILKDHR